MAFAEARIRQVKGEADARDQAHATQREAARQEVAAWSKKFEATYVAGRPKAKRLIDEHGFPDDVKTGSGGTALWMYPDTANGLDRVKVLTLRIKDGELVDLSNRLR